MAITDILNKVTIRLIMIVKVFFFILIPPIKSFVYKNEFKCLKDIDTLSGTVLKLLHNGYQIENNKFLPSYTYLFDQNKRYRF